MAKYPIPLDSFYEFQHASLFRWKNLLRVNLLVHGKKRQRLIEGICHQVARTQSALFHEENRITSLQDKMRIKAIYSELEQYRKKIQEVVKTHSTLGEKIIQSIHRFHEKPSLGELAKGKPMEWRLSLRLLSEQEISKPQKI